MPPKTPHSQLSTSAGRCLHWAHLASWVGCTTAGLQAPVAPAQHHDNVRSPYILANMFTVGCPSGTSAGLSALCPHTGPCQRSTSAGAKTLQAHLAELPKVLHQSY